MIPPEATILLEEGEMILPTPEFDPMFADDGIPFRQKMIGYIQREFSDLLGTDGSLLAREGGLEVLSERYRANRQAKSFTSLPISSSREAA